GHRGKRAGGFFRSADGGLTWKESKELQGEAIHAMTQALSDPKMLFVGTSNGVWVSKNSGEDWTKIESGTLPVNVNSLAIDPKMLFVGTSNGVWVSKNSGEDWTKIESGTLPVNVNSLEIDPTKTSTIYA